MAPPITYNIGYEGRNNEHTSAFLYSCREGEGVPGERQVMLMPSILFQEVVWIDNC